MHIPAVNNSITSWREGWASCELKADQLRACQMVDALAMTQGVLEIAPGNAGVLPGEQFGAHAFAIGDGLDDGAVLIGGYEE